MPGMFKKRKFEIDLDDPETPEAIRKLSPDEVAERLEKSFESDAALAKANEDLAALRTSHDTMSGEFNTVKSRLQQLEANRGQGGGDERGRSEGRRSGGDETEPASIFVDEEAGMARHLKPLSDVVGATGGITAKLAFENWLKKQKTEPGSLSPIRIYEKYEGDIDKIMQNEPAGNRMNPQSWATAFNVVAGYHMNDIVKAARTEGNNEFFSESGGSGAGGGQGPQGSGDGGNKKDELTPEEAYVARKSGISPEDYKKRKSTMRDWAPQINIKE